VVRALPGFFLTVLLKGYRALCGFALVKDYLMAYNESDIFHNHKRSVAVSIG